LEETNSPAAISVDLMARHAGDGGRLRHAHHGLFRPVRPRAAAAASVNFVTVHDGFTLLDLVSCDAKHNQLNGEGNRDWVRRQPQLELWRRRRDRRPVGAALRARRRRNLLAALLFSEGMPLLGGDEFNRTQRGNNNAHC
jgi:pullulanase/glycogen debranching enzyme